MYACVCMNVFPSFCHGVDFPSVKVRLDRGILLLPPHHSSGGSHYTDCGVVWFLNSSLVNSPLRKSIYFGDGVQGGGGRNREVDGPSISAWACSKWGISENVGQQFGAQLAKMRCITLHHSIRKPFEMSCECLLRTHSRIKSG